MKGQMFSLIAILLVIPILLFLSFSFDNVQISSSRQIEKIVADQESQLANNMESDFIRAEEISTKRAILSSVNKIVLTGVPINDSTSGLIELLSNGTLEGNISVIMRGNSLSDWINKVMSLDTGFQSTLNYANLNVENHDGFNLKVSVDIIINISDNLKTSEINRITSSVITVSVENFEDPMYALGTGGLSGRTIKKYSYPYYAKKIATGSGDGDCAGNATFDVGDPDNSKILVTYNGSGISNFAGVVSETGDLPLVSCYLTGITNITNLVNQTIIESNYEILYIDNITSGVWSIPIADNLDKYFQFTASGPNFLERLEGSLDNSTNGLETFALQESGVPDKPEQSRIAHQFFSSSSISGDPVRGFPSWFRIDPNQAGKYNLTQLLD